jgi:signal transduction histidine kinase
MANVLHRLRAALGASSARTTWPPTRALQLYQGHWLILICAPLLLAILATGLVTLHNVNTLVTTEHAISHVDAVQAQIHVVETQLVDTEDILRGDLLSNDSTYLAPYAIASKTLVAEVAKLQILTGSDTSMQRQIAILEPKVAPLLTVWQHAIDLHAQQRTAEAIAAMRAANVQQTVTDIRALLADMEMITDRQRATLLHTASSGVTSTQVTLLGATAADIALTLALFALVWHAFAERARRLRTERAARATAEEAVALRDEFLSIASHELRTPLTVLRGNIQLLERFLARMAEQDERVQQSFAIIHRQIARLEALIATMLDVSRIGREQLTIVRDLLDLVALVRTVVDEMRPTAQAQGHPIELITPSDPTLTLYVHGDAPRLEQVLLNLLQNAIKYSPGGGPIHVEMARSEDWALLCVRDFGMGIPADALPHVFERFYRAPEVRSEHISGMGIGLYVVHEIVVLHGGDVTVRSEHGAGATFIVRLPLAVPQPSGFITDSPN